MILGVDPGMTGAIAWLTDQGELIEVMDMPTLDNRVDGRSLAEKIRFMATQEGDGYLYAVVEKVHSMPQQGVASTFKFGVAYGVALGVLDALGIPIKDVRPAKWKKDLGIGSDKEAGRLMAIDMWPTSKFVFKRKKDHGRAEAALIGHWSLL